MNEQSSKEAILQKTLHVLVRQIGLTPTEVSELRLSDLHLAGKNPNISFTPAKGASPKTVDLDLEAHRALVGWLVARPDSVSDFLFLKDNSDPMTPADIEQVAQAFDRADVPDQPVNTGDPETSSGAEMSSADKDSTDMPVPPSTTGPRPPLSKPESPPARLVPSMPPRSVPERGTPPPGFQPGQPVPPTSRPPSSVPEGDDRLPGDPQPLPGSQSDQPGVVPGQAPQPLGHSGEPRLVPKAVRTTRPRVPPKPVRKKDSGQAPVIMKQKAPDSGQEAGGRPTPPTDVEASQDAPAQSPTAEAPPTEAPKTEEKTHIPVPPPQAGISPAQSKTPPLKKEVKPYKSKSQGPVKPRVQTGSNRPAILSFTLGGILVALALCVVCVGGGALFALLTESGNGLLAGLGLSGIISGEDALEPDDATGDEVVRLVTPSPIPSPTATLPPTNTPTLLPPTDTPAPNDTPTPVPPPTEPPPPPTDTPIPTDTPLPPDTPTPEPPPATSPPTETPTPEASPTPAMKYETPVLLEPEDGFGFIGGNTLVLRWEPVDLAPDEQYAVRLVYRFNGQTTFQGTNLKEPQWTIPLSLYGQIDPPDNLYEWFVVIERLNSDGSGTAISPESERRTFTWK